MKCLYFLLFLTVAQGFVLNERNVPAPTLKSLVAVNPPGIEIMWTVVSNMDASDPVLGYKVKIWEVPTIKEYKLENGEIVLVGEKETPMDLYKPLNNEPRVVLVLGGNKDKLMVNNVKTGTSYEVRIQAYTEKMDGPLSLPMRIKIE